MICDDCIVFSYLQVKATIIADIDPCKGACYELIYVTSQGVYCLTRGFAVRGGLKVAAQFEKIVSGHRYFAASVSLGAWILQVPVPPSRDIGL